MSLKARILDDVKNAMRARETERLGVLRLISAAMKQIEVDQRIELDDEMVLTILNKMVKQRRESLEQFEKADREDLASKERYELEIIGVYMPEPLAEEELSALIQTVIQNLGASSVRDMGAVMNALRAEVHGRADMKAVSQAVRTQLGA